jgi:hypothetical protein
MKTLDFNEPMVYDDMNNLMMEHVAVFKVLLDKTHALNEKKAKGQLGKRDFNKFEKLGEIDDDLNGVVRALDN